MATNIGKQTDSLLIRLLVVTCCLVVPTTFQQSLTHTPMIKKKVLVRMGERHQLECRSRVRVSSDNTTSWVATPDDTPYTWFSQPTSKSGNKTLIPNVSGRVYNISVPYTAHSLQGLLAVYTATFRSGNQSGGCEFNVSLRSLPLFNTSGDLPLVNVIIHERGKLLELTCPAQGSPEPSVSWYKDKKPLNMDTFRQTRGMSLTFINPQLADSGNYTCVAQNSEGTVKNPGVIALVIHVPLSIRYSSMSNIFATQGRTVEVTCQFTGYPLQQISFKWMNEGKTVKQDSRHVFITSACAGQVCSSSLVIQSLKVADSGLLSCAASNLYSSTFSYFMLVVSEFENQRDPTSNTTDGTAAVLVGETISLPCVSLTNMVKPVAAEKVTENGGIWWEGPHGDIITRDKECLAGGIHGSQGIPRCMQMDDEGSLLLRNVLSDDNGRYICHLNQSNGSGDKGVFLQVYVPPKISNKFPADINADHHQQITLYCNGSGNPLPSVRWYRDGIPADKYQGWQIPVRFANKLGVAVIENQYLHEDAAGSYTCLATNKAGEDKAATKITVNVAPEIELNPVLVMTSGVHMSWVLKYDGGAPVKNYTVRHTLLQGDVSQAPVETHLLPFQTEVFITNLTEGATYRLEVWPESRLGRGHIQGEDIKIPRSKTIWKPYVHVSKPWKTAVGVIFSVGAAICLGVFCSYFIYRRRLQSQHADPPGRSHTGTSFTNPISEMLAAWRGGEYSRIISGQQGTSTQPTESGKQKKKIIPTISFKPENRQHQLEENA